MYIQEICMYSKCVIMGSQEAYCGLCDILKWISIDCLGCSIPICEECKDSNQLIEFCMECENFSDQETN